MCYGLKKFLQEYMPKEKARHDFRSVEAQKRVKETQQETDGRNRQETDCFIGLLYASGNEEADHDSM